MKNNCKIQDSAMQSEVWKMKDILFHEIENLNCNELFAYINQKTEKAAKAIQNKGKTAITDILF